jgi:hypothetical protein
MTRCASLRLYDNIWRRAPSAILPTSELIGDEAVESWQA